MKVKIIKRGLFIYLAELIAGIVFSSYYGGPVAYAPLYALLLVIPVSIIYIVINRSFLMVYQAVEVHKLTKGEDHKYRALIENAGLLPIHNMEIGTYKSRCNLYEIPDKTKLSLDIQEEKEIISILICRDYICTVPSALELFLRAIDWRNPLEVSIANSYLKKWIKIDYSDAISLFDSRFPDIILREYAISKRFFR